VTEKHRTADKKQPRPQRKCPICGKPATEEAYPFCSRGCANIDLNRWLSGRYVIPAAPDEEGDGPGEDDGEK
jgi:uncharacterized protein